MRIHVLALDGAFDLGLSAVLDAFQTANELAQMSGFSGKQFDVKIVGVRRSVKTAQGLTVPVQAIGSRAPDCVVVPAIGFKMPEPLQAALTRPEIRDAAAVLRQWHRKGALMTAACVGTFIMAESGLLDRQRATSTWWLVPMFRRRYPGVSLDESQMIAAASLVEGQHDFTSFAAVDPEKRNAPEKRKDPENRHQEIEINNVRTIFHSQWQRHADELVYTVRGNGFLHHMVRNLVGTFLMVGKGSLTVQDVRRILELRDRSAAAATAPASGLFLVSVEY